MIKTGHSPTKYYISLHPVSFSNLSGFTLFYNYQDGSALNGSKHSQLITDMDVWLKETLVPDVDYRWSTLIYRNVHLTGVDSFPMGLYFINEPDALVFKLKFGL
jgi:hypothetical protein